MLCFDKHQLIKLYLYNFVQDLENKYLEYNYKYMSGLPYFPCYHSTNDKDHGRMLCGEAARLNSRLQCPPPPRSICREEGRGRWCVEPAGHATRAV